MLPIAREGLREIAVSTLVLATLALGAWWLWAPLTVLPVALWIWVLLFFRDPRRQRTFEPGELCAPADGRVTEITELDSHATIGGPALRIGIFLSLFDVHCNRAPCAGRVRSVTYSEGKFLDARHPDSGSQNESNTVVIAPDAPLPGPVVVRQVAGLVARRIICHGKVGDHWPIGHRFGMIKFGSRTELIVPRVGGTEACVRIGDAVYAGLTVMVRQPFPAAPASNGARSAPEALGPARSKPEPDRATAR